MKSCNKCEFYKMTPISIIKSLDNLLYTKDNSKLNKI